MRRLALASATAILAAPAMADEPACFSREEVASTMAGLGFELSFVGVTALGEGLIIVTNQQTGGWILIADEGPFRSCVIVGGPSFRMSAPGVPS